jgi:two-component system, NtrC family, sensor histidine kinase HydH
MTAPGRANRYPSRRVPFCCDPLCVFAYVYRPRRSDPRSALKGYTLNMRQIKGPEYLIMKYRPPFGLRVAIVAAGILVVAMLHHVIPLSMLHWQNALQHLYYFPIVLAGLSLGWRGGLAAAAFATLSNLPFNIGIWNSLPNFAIEQISEVPLFCAAGAFTGVLAERERKQRADLERTTKQLTKVYQELQDNFERLKRAERLFALGQLSAGLAHEVRNPLASIAGAAGILQRNLRLEAKEAECLGIITKECQRLNHLVAHFLAFARPRDPRYQSVEIGSLFDSVLELAAHAVDGRPITLRREVGAIGPIQCDPELMKQVLLNMVINSIQAMPHGGEVLLSAKPRDTRVLIQVKDEGCGIGALDRDKVFDPFFTTKETGTGLGLSVAHKIVEQHGGILTAEGNPKKGMTFSVQIPMRQSRHHEA